MSKLKPEDCTYSERRLEVLARAVTESFVAVRVSAQADPALATYRMGRQLGNTVQSISPGDARTLHDLWRHGLLTAATENQVGQRRLTVSRHGHDALNRWRERYERHQARLREKLEDAGELT